MTLIVLGIYVLAVMRLTRLINADTVLDGPRLAIIKKAHAAREAAIEARATSAVAFLRAERSAKRWATAVYFIQCPWCVGMWLSLASAIAPVLVLDWPWWAFFPIALATSHLIGVLARFADTEEIDVEDVDDE